MTELMSYNFPGNVRELRNILERAITLCEDDSIEATDLGLSAGDGVSQENLSATPQTTNEDSEDAAAEPSDLQEATLTQDGEALPSTLPEDAESLESYLENIEKNVIVDALEATRWNKTAAAKRLGISFRALRYKLKKLGLE